MAAEIVFREPHWTDLVRVAGQVRAADAAECAAAGLTPLRALQHSLARSPNLRWAITADCEPIALMGCADLLTHGEPWMLGTDGVRQHGRRLMRLCRPYIAAMVRVHPVLQNFVHAENAVSIGWLKRVGFEVHPAQPYGAHGAPFHRFEMRR